MSTKRIACGARSITPLRPALLTVAHYLQVGGDDTLIASDEIDLTQAPAREQRSRGEVGASRTPLWTQSTNNSVHAWLVRTEGVGGLKPAPTRPACFSATKEKCGVAIVSGGAALKTFTGSAFSPQLKRFVSRWNAHVRSIHPPPNAGRH